MTTVDLVIILENMAGIAHTFRGLAKYGKSFDSSSDPAVSCRCKALEDIARQLFEDRDRLRSLIPNVSLIEPIRDE